MTHSLSHSSQLTNEVPPHEQWRLALLAASVCITSRRPFVGNSSDVDAHPGGTSVGTIGGATSGAQNPTSTNSAPNTSGSGASSNDATSLFSTGLLQTIDAENLNVMGSILREWRRLPLIVTNQHVRLLQVSLLCFLKKF